MTPADIQAFYKTFNISDIKMTHSNKKNGEAKTDEEEIEGFAPNYTTKHFYNFRA